MGRHSAGSRARVDPIVAAALSQRAASVEPPQPRPAPDRSEGEQDGGLGWPGEPGEGSGLGWPADTTPADTTAADTDPEDTRGQDTSAVGTAATDVTVTDTAVAALPVAPAARDGGPSRRRFGWRRWFGGGSAVPPTPSGSNAA
ncbi:hypothetical protein [Modestobacter sp. VKM Ac-2985]|uniref:hypothetical protein n=1 Tax=Modestobacter sp. VKM Ac-2985 TaxID=3004139 RepID=UPI0022AB9BDC|nr:hypothetical protein [Modestobacter sp. VKM Ac-2985]MCZ2838374.1 hypothetical protein [Modestobacter sp. VKM Ac-2985]